MLVLKFDGSRVGHTLGEGFKQTKKWKILQIDL